jgi:sulfur carrier protein
LKVTVNGKAAEAEENASLRDFIETLREHSEGIIAELNEKVVSRDRWAETLLREGDRLELVSLVGGG